ncbi:MAG: glutathione peroxidase [Betaproteobacteria bacterium]
MQSIFEFSAKDIKGDELDFSRFKDQVLLLVNTASACGFTPQLKGLQELHTSYSARGLVVMGFPCNQFGGQDPKSEEEIAQFCATQYGVEFLLMQKIEVNGEEAHPLFKWLKAQAPGLLNTQAIKWNFTKFLVGKNGQVLKRFAPQDAPSSLSSEIELALKAQP